MSTADIAIIAENAVILAAIGARWSLLRQGGGLQEKTPPVPPSRAGKSGRKSGGQVSDAGKDGPDAMAELDRMHRDALEHIPAETTP